MRVGPAPATRPLEREPGHGQDGEHIVAVDADARDPETLAPLGDRGDAAGRPPVPEMAHWLFWQKKTTGRLEARR